MSTYMFNNNNNKKGMQIYALDPGRLCSAFDVLSRGEPVAWRVYIIL